MTRTVLDELVVAESVRFPAGGFLLEGELTYPEESVPLAGAVVAGPHPLLGGTMHNNVVAALTRDLAHRGLATLRFNYRGTGQSEGPPVDVVSRLAEFWKTSHISEESAYQEDLVSTVSSSRKWWAKAHPWSELAIVSAARSCPRTPGRVAHWF